MPAHRTTAPMLTYSTYLPDAFTPNAIASDSSGNIYLAGIAASYVTSEAGFVTKLNPQNGQYLYQSFLNGQVNAIAVDAAGNAYVAGNAYAAGANASDQTTEQGFVAKLDPNGNVLFTTTLGGSATGTALAIALSAHGQIIVSGISTSSGFPSTPGAPYSASNTANHPYLLELDPTGTTTIFSATGIGGNSIALDSAGSIYVAGVTTLLDYPTTRGVYEPTFPMVIGCTSPLCQIEGQIPVQYLTKIDPSGSKLIYSTALPGSTNTGLAVDAEGNAYITGISVSFPYSVTPPAVPVSQTFSWEGLPFLAKLDPAGRNLLFAVPVGGAGVRVDSSGTVYVAGGIGEIAYSNYSIDASLPALSNVTPCRPNQLNVEESGYVSQVDGLSGDVLATQFIGGSSLSIFATALSGHTLWVAGPTYNPLVPFTPNAPAPGNISTSAGRGEYLGAVDFSQPAPAPGSPQIFCILNADGTEVGPAALLQLVSIFGTELGPDIGVSATDYKTTTLAGVEVTVGGTPAPLLYVSSTQINFAIPALPSNSTFPAVQVSVASLSSAVRAFPITSADPTLFMNIQQSVPESVMFIPIALNADGSINSFTNPAKPGSIISVFVDGLAPDPNQTSGPIQLTAQGGFTVVAAAQPNPFLWQVSLQTPSTVPPPSSTAFECPASGGVCSLGFTLSYGGPNPVGMGFANSAFVFVISTR
ncbi:MAG TPA: IPT/TIG domain-containing protein [Bryobacteraceae bacterium]